MDTQPRFLRLKNGDDLITEYVELTCNDVTTIQLVNPLKIMYVPGNHPGTVHIGLAPWLVMSITDKQEFTIKQDDILLNTDITEKMMEHYWASLEAFNNPEPEPIEEEGEEEEYDITTKRTFH